MVSNSSDGSESAPSVVSSIVSVEPAPSPSSVLGLALLSLPAL